MGIGNRVSLLSWEQNFEPPHLSRTTKLDVTNSVWNLLAEKVMISRLTDFSCTFLILIKIHF